MPVSRRDLIMLTTASMSTLALRSAGLRAAETPKLGLIFPPAGRGVPEEGIAMYGAGVEFLVEGLGLATMTPDGYEAVIDRIGPTAAMLAERGAEAIALMGTSLSFYKGEAFNQRLTETIRTATGLPAITMSTAVIEGLKSVQAKNVAVATAYNGDVNGRLSSFLAEHGFEVSEIRGLGIEKVEDIFSVTQPQLIDFSADVYASARTADSILVSCGGLRTLEILDPLETRCRVPAVSSTPHALRAGVRLLGLSGEVPGYGKLLSMT
jgi:arylmalonate decarboxylase